MPNASFQAISPNLPAATRFLPSDGTRALQGSPFCQHVCCQKTPQLPTSGAGRQKKSPHASLGPPEANRRICWPPKLVNHSHLRRKAERSFATFAIPSLKYADSAAQRLNRWCPTSPQKYNRVECCQRDMVPSRRYYFDRTGGNCQAAAMTRSTGLRRWGGKRIS